MVWDVYNSLSCSLPDFEWNLMKSHGKQTYTKSFKVFLLNPNLVVESNLIFSKVLRQSFFYGLVPYKSSKKLVQLQPFPCLQLRFSVVVGTKRRRRFRILKFKPLWLTRRCRFWLEGPSHGLEVCYCLFVVSWFVAACKGQSELFHL